jgi:hypothetical protein
LETLKIVINLIASTRTETGLEVHAYLDQKNYPVKLKVTDDQIAEVHLFRNKFRGEWNYAIRAQR